MDRSKILVVYYSRSGTTRNIAQALADALHCDLEEITEPKSRNGFLGYMRSATEAVLKRSAIVDTKQRDVAAYDLVIIGTPVWGSSLSSPVRAYLMATAAQLPDVAFFCTLGGMGSDSTFAQMTAIAGKNPRAVCAIRQKDVEARTYSGQFATFEKALGAISTNAGSARV